MSELSKTVLPLTQNNQVIANTQQQNHAKQKAEAFGALAAATEEKRYDALFTAIPKYDGTNKENCTIWISRISSLATSTGRDLRMELLNRPEGNVMMMLAGMNKEIDDEGVKEELMRCFSNALTTIQAIGVLRGMKQRPDEQARLYTVRYKVIHRAN